jgi:hypothetical protein
MLALAALLAIADAQPAHHPAAAAQPAPLPAELPLDLAGLPRSTARLSAHGRTQACEGVALAALAAKAGLPAGADLRGPALGIGIIAEAQDGYRVLFSLGEIDRKLGNRTVIVADRCDGKALGAEDGPLRLVVPGETRAARSVRQLVRLRVVKTGD